MTTKSIGTRVTVAEAIKAGKRKAYWPALAIFLGALLLFFPMLKYVHFDPELLFWFTFGIGMVAAWAWWAYHIVVWRFWAVANVQDLHKLEAKAVANDLINNGLNEIGKTEIASAKTRIRYKQWYQKFAENATHKRKSDSLLPKYVVLHYSWWSQIRMIWTASIGFVLLCGTLKDPPNAEISKFLLGLGLFGLGGYHLFLFSRKKASVPHALKITKKWIQFEHQAPVWWREVRMVITIIEGTKYHRYYIQLRTNEKIMKWDVTDLNLSQDKLDHYLDVFRTRGRSSANA